MTRTVPLNNKVKKNRELPSASVKVMSLLAKRNYSEKELEQKLSRDYSSEELQLALNLARESKWILPPLELAERVAAELSRKKKSHRFIRHYLQQKGLPPLPKILTSEVEKGQAILRSKLKNCPSLLSREAQIKARRLLANRGYDDDVIRQVLAHYSD